MRPLELDMTHPDVRRMVDEDRSRLATGKPERELVHIAGDMDTGITTSWQMDAAKREVTVTYRDFVLTVDVYQIPGEPTKVHLICPRCHHALSVSSERKRIDYDPKAGDTKKGGLLSIEAFDCTWEIDDQAKHTPGLVAGGMNLCRWRAGIEANVARDA